MAVRYTQPTQAQQPGLLTNIARGILDPIRKTAGQGFEAGTRLAELTGSRPASQLGVKNPFLNTTEVQSATQSAIPQAIKNLLGITSRVMPTKTIAAGAGSGILDALSQDNASVGSVATSGLIGGGTVGILNRLLGTGGSKPITQTIGGKAENLGNKIRSGVLNPQVPVSPTAPAKETALSKLQEQLGLKGRAQAQRVQVNQIYNKLSEDIGGVLDKTNKFIAKPNLLERVKNIVSEDGQYYLPGDTTYDNLLTRQLTRLNKVTKDPAAALKSIYEHKLKVGDDLKNAFRKIGGELNTPLDLNERVGLDVWNALDRIITETEPAVKELSSQQSQLYSLAPGLTKKAKEAYRLPVVGVRIPTAPVQSIEDFAGRGLISGGRAMQQGAESLSNITDDSGILRRLGVQGALGTTQGSEAPARPETTDMNSLSTLTPSTGQTGDNQDALKLALSLGLARGDITSSDITAFQTLGLLPEKQDTNTRKRKVVLQQAAPVLKRVVESAVKAPTGAGGTILSNLGRIPGVEGGEAEFLRRDTEGFARLIAAAFASEVGVATDQDVTRWKALMPQPGDTKAERKRQSEKLIQQIRSESRLLGVDVPQEIEETASLLSRY
jgi:hypothetical protein